VVVYKGVFYHSGGRKINVSLVFYLFSRDGLMRCPSPPQLWFDLGSEECGVLGELCTACPPVSVDQLASRC
jgi:hypothetical protein